MIISEVRERNVSECHFLNCRYMTVNNYCMFLTILFIFVIKLVVELLPAYAKMSN